MSEYTQERLRALLYRTQKRRPLMPPPVFPVTIDDNLVFLWRAIQHSNYTKIDFSLLGSDFQLNREEALECFRELRRAIEDAVYNNYMEKSNAKRDSAGPSNILSLAVRRRKEAAAAEEDAEYEEDEHFEGPSNAGTGSSNGGSSVAGSSKTLNASGSRAASASVGHVNVASSQTGTLKADPTNVKASNAGPSRTGTPCVANSGAASASADASNAGPSNTGHSNVGSLKNGSSVAGPPRAGTPSANPPGPRNSKTGPSNAGVAQTGSASVPSNAGHLNATHHSAGRSSAGPSNTGPNAGYANVSAWRAAPSNIEPPNVPSNAGSQNNGNSSAVKAADEPAMDPFNAGQAYGGVKLAPIRPGQTVNLPLPRITNPAGPPSNVALSANQSSSVGFSSSFLPGVIPAPGAIDSGLPIARPSNIVVSSYFPPSAIPSPGAANLGPMMPAQPPNQQPSNRPEDGPVVLDLTGLRCFLGALDQGVGPTVASDKVFSRSGYYFPIRIPFPTSVYPYGPMIGPDVSRASESQLPVARPSIPLMPPMLAERPSSPAIMEMDKGKKRKRESGSEGDMGDDRSGKDKDHAQ